MQYLRNRLGLKQIPRVLDWSSRASDTPVGAEYIIMEVADGVELEKVWPQMTMGQKLDLVEEWIKIEMNVITALSSARGYGSLYFRQDVPPEQVLEISTEDGHTDSDFVLGPSTSQLGYWETCYGSSEIGLDRGPWPNVHAVLQSISDHERACIKQFASPMDAKGRTFFAPWETPPHLQDHEKHFRLLDQYDRVAKRLADVSDAGVFRPTLTLRDSNQANIFISAEAFIRDGSVKITSVIDLQHAAVLPLYLTSTLPAFIEVADPSPGQSEEDLSEEKKYLRHCYDTLYRDTNRDRAWASCLPVKGTPSIAQRLPIAAQRCWHGGFVSLQSMLISIQQHWEQEMQDQSAGPCPLELDMVNSVQAMEDVSAWEASQSELQKIASAIGVADDGWVNRKDYKKAVQTNDELRHLWIQSLGEKERVGLKGVDPADLWPFGATRAA